MFAQPIMAAAPTAVGQTSPELRSPGQPTGTPPRPASERQMISSFEHQLSKATQTGTADGQLRRRRTKPTAYQRGQAGRRRVQQHTQEGLGAEAGGALCCRVTKKKTYLRQDCASWAMHGHAGPHQQKGNRGGFAELMRKYDGADYFRQCEPCQRTLEVVNIVFAYDKPPVSRFFGHSGSLAKLTSRVCFFVERFAE